ncbi:hypothetical protein M6G53_01340 [Serratia nevei]|uniref:hypothetical protein n=1 Tax=Serratia nevei TaxID=2703794 RepID=UPI00209F63F9|nr:hypothetical protein [Serratia nevei]MCP1104038.1 hypothetical protein [Serratia nevei]
MTTYHFYVKGSRIEVLKATAHDAEDRKRDLQELGFEKQHEELTAVSEAAALMRFKDIRKEMHGAEHTLATGAVFTSLLGALIKNG